METIATMPLRTAHPALMPALAGSTVLHVDPRDGFDATSVSAVRDVIGGMSARLRCVGDDNLTVMGEVSDQGAGMDVPAYRKSAFAGGVRCSLPDWPPV